ncbi:hypothetical protein [Bradyrhizobium canariense]|uniref:hypothetical protein n=1 Tax=Bradyrhizobium canariense TaxID=255045 RepID=UPI0011BABD17|nr:hypothetical protein [Bradyrhizobium canariense]
MPVEKAWLELRGAVSDGRIAIWGQKFELPADFELGDVWPRGSQRRLTASDLFGMCLIDVRGMAVRPEGLIFAGQTRCCRISMQTDQLQSEFPQASVKTLQGRKPQRNHKGQAAWGVHLKIFRAKLINKALVNKHTCPAE